jgi:hypothetical protein
MDAFTPQIGSFTRPTNQLGSRDHKPMIRAISSMNEKERQEYFGPVSPTSKRIGK